jgi:N-hydroxyarylamine O-acetyltransferase
MEMIDFMPVNYYNSTHPDAVFVQRYLVMLQRADGRTLLSGNQLKQLRGDQEEITEITPEQLDDVLWREFKLQR